MFEKILKGNFSKFPLSRRRQKKLPVIYSFISDDGRAEGAYDLGLGRDLQLAVADFFDGVFDASVQGHAAGECHVVCHAQPVGKRVDARGDALVQAGNDVLARLLARHEANDFALGEHRTRVADLHRII